MTESRELVTQPWSRELISKIAMDIGKEAVHHLEIMYPAAISACPGTMKLSLRNCIHNSIRCFYRRRNDQPGTRITFIDGRGFVVMEHYSEVKALLEGGHIDLNVRAPNAEAPAAAQ